jgi:hypothetical protein
MKIKCSVLLWPFLVLNFYRIFFYVWLWSSDCMPPAPVVRLKKSSSEWGVSIVQDFVYS